jgi:PAS domain S-box-containing protein
MNKSQDGIWIIDVEGKTVYVSERMAEILGASATEMIGRDAFDFVYPKYVPQATRLFELKARGDIAPFRFKLRRQEGAPVWVKLPGDSIAQCGGSLQWNSRNVHDFKLNHCPRFRSPIPMEVRLGAQSHIMERQPLVELFSPLPEWCNHSRGGGMCPVALTGYEFGTIKGIVRVP